MSKRKRNVSFIKPDEPAFIARMKAQIGFKEGPTVDTKREALPSDEEDSDERADEQPQVVVLKEGDMTAEEAEKAKADLEQAPANLAERIVFCKPEKKKAKVESSTDVEGVLKKDIENKHETKDTESKQGKSSSSKQKKGKPSALMDTETSAECTEQVESATSEPLRQSSNTLLEEMDYSLLSVDLSKLLHISSGESPSDTDSSHRYRSIPHCNLSRSKLRQCNELEDINFCKCTFCCASFTTKALLARHTLRIHQKAVVSLLQEHSTPQHLMCLFCVNKVMHHHQRLLLLHLEKKHALQIVTFLKQNVISTSGVTRERKPTCNLRIPPTGLCGITLSNSARQTDAGQSDHCVDEESCASSRNLESINLFHSSSISSVSKGVPNKCDETQPGLFENLQVFHCSRVILNGCGSGLSKFPKKSGTTPFAKRKLQLDGPQAKTLSRVNVKENLHPLEPLSTVLARSSWKHGQGKHYVCGRCGEAFSCNAFLLDHVHTKHGGSSRLLLPLYTCGLCAASFYKNSFLVRHCYQHYKR